MMAQTVVRLRIRVEGTVQGVGFRPFVYGLATRYGLAGLVGNDVDGVFIEVEGDQSTVDGFRDALRAQAPPLAVIERVTADAMTPHGSGGFAIVPSPRGGNARTQIAPDVATCADCLVELLDPRNRRYRYPFINCTNCGPRFTIMRDLPYDRRTTTMAGFEMCEACATEYRDPLDRRFHAQPIACSDCGPTLRLICHRQRESAARTASDSRRGEPVAGRRNRRDQRPRRIPSGSRRPVAASHRRAASPQTSRGQALRGHGRRSGSTVPCGRGVGPSAQRTGPAHRPTPPA